MNYERKFNQWNINFLTQQSLIYITIKHLTSNDIFHESFKFEYFHSFNLFIPKITMKDLIDFILMLINNKSIEIKQEQNKIKLIFISPYLNTHNVELILNKIENIHKENNKKKFEFNQINSIKPHNKAINQVSIFPNGNIISVSSDQSINIYNPNLIIIQRIIDAHDKYIIDLCVKDENNFISCSFDKSIKTWIKENLRNKFIINKIIKEAHNDWLGKVIFFNENIISCSKDLTVKIWEENNNNSFQCKTILSHSDWIVSLFIIEKSNILISGSEEGTKFWNLNNLECLFFIKEAKCFFWNALKKIDNDKIIIGGDVDGLIKIISISQKKIIKNIKNKFQCWGILVLENKGLILISGRSQDIKIYGNNNYNLIKTLTNIHEHWIYGLTRINENSFVSFSKDCCIKVWNIS